MIKLSFKNPYLALVLAILVTVLAAVLIPRMPVDILPQFKKSAMQILTLYPGMPAEVVEKDIRSKPFVFVLMPYCMRNPHRSRLRVPLPLRNHKRRQRP